MLIFHFIVGFRVYGGMVRFRSIVAHTLMRLHGLPRLSKTASGNARFGTAALHSVCYWFHIMNLVKLCGWGSSFVSCQDSNKDVSLLRNIIDFYKERKRTYFEDLNDWALALGGVISFLVAGYFGLVLSGIVPNFVKIINQSSITKEAIVIGLLLGFYGLIFWFFGCIAARCHSLIYERWFR